MNDHEFNINLKNNDEVIANKKQFVTTREVYNNVYTNQLLEIFKLATSFILSYLFLYLLENVLLDSYKNNKIMYSIILIICIIAFILITVRTFTYLKIKNDNNTFLQQVHVTNQNK